MALALAPSRESCLKNVHCHTDRASWDAILVTVAAFGALMWKSVHSHTDSAWGGWGGGGGDTIGGGVGEPRTGIIHAVHACAHSHTQEHV